MVLLKRIVIILLVLISVVSCTNQEKKKRPTFTLAASIYVGWMPWFLAAEDGTLDKAAKKQNININFVRGDYIETISQFAAGGVDAVVLTNIDAFSLLYDSGVETDVILISSYSNGNDALVVPKTATENEPFNLEDKTIGLVEYSVSHYLLDRLLEKRNIPYNKIRVTNVSDSEIGAVFSSSSKKMDGVITWNPIVMQLENNLQGHRVADSSEIKYEIADMLVVRRSVLEKNPEFASALLATWFEMMRTMTGTNKDTVLTRLGQLSGANKKDYTDQLKTTDLVVTVSRAQNELIRKEIKGSMHHIREFAIRHNLVTVDSNEVIVSYGEEQKKQIHFSPNALKDYSLQK